MKQAIVIAALFCGFTVSAGTAAFADAPGVLDFSGRLGDASGIYDGQVELTITLYDHASSFDSGHVIWTESSKISVSDGRFHVLLGADVGNPIPLDLLATNEVYVGVRADDDDEISPRLRVASVPYAMMASEAATLDGMTAADFVAAGELSSINGAMITDGSLSLSDIGETPGCVPGEVAKWNGQTWSCQEDEDTQYLAGAGISIQYQTISIDPQYIEDMSRDACYDKASEIEAALTGWDSNASDDLTKTTSFGGDVSGSYGNLTIKPGKVGGSHLANNAVSTAKILDKSVTSTKIANGAVGGSQLANVVVTAAKIASDAVTESKIASSAVTSTQLAYKAVTSSKIADDAVAASQLADNAVTSNKLAANAVTNSRIASSAVTSTKIGAGAVTESKIASGAVTNAKIGGNAITASKIKPGSIDETRLQNGAVARHTIKGTEMPVYKVHSSCATGDLLSFRSWCYCGSKQCNNTIVGYLLGTDSL